MLEIARDVFVEFVDVLGRRQAEVSAGGVAWPCQGSHPCMIDFGDGFRCSVKAAGEQQFVF